MTVWVWFDQIWLTDQILIVAKSWLKLWRRPHNPLSPTEHMCWLKKKEFSIFYVDMNVHSHDTLAAVLTQQMPSYRVISSLHSSGALALLGTDRKRVVLSVEGWSRLRTQHSSPDLDHWPANAQRDLSYQQEAGQKWSDAEGKYLTFT